MARSLKTVLPPIHAGKIVELTTISFYMSSSTVYQLCQVDCMPGMYQGLSQYPWRLILVYNSEMIQYINTLLQYMSRLMRKPTICICENKDADQLRSHCEADQRLCFRYSDSTIPLRLKSEISSFKLFSVHVQVGLCRTCSETTLLVFPRGGSYMYMHNNI